MSPVMMGSKQVKGITAEELAGRSESLAGALEQGDGQLDGEQRAVKRHRLVQNVAVGL